MATSTERDPLSGVCVFVAAARADNFTQAAERIGLTKSSVGKTIARLELRLGIKLFHRTTRLTRLTADGEAYLAACTSALDEITAAQAALSSSNRVLSGRTVAFGRRVLLPALIEITRPHPGLGLAQFPISLVRGHLDGGQLRAVLQGYSGTGVDIHAVWPKRAHLSPRVRYVVDELVAYAAKGRFN